MYVCVHAFGIRKGGGGGEKRRKEERTKNEEHGQHTLIVGVGPVGEDLQELQGGLMLRAPQLYVW